MDLWLSVALELASLATSTSAEVASVVGLARLEHESTLAQWAPAHVAHTTTIALEAHHVWLRDKHGLLSVAHTHHWCTHHWGCHHRRSHHRSCHHWSCHWHAHWCTHRGHHWSTHWHTHRSAHWWSTHWLWWYTHWSSVWLVRYVWCVWIWIAGIWLRRGIFKK